MTIAELHAASKGRDWTWYICVIAAYLFDGDGNGLAILNIAPCKDRQGLYYVEHPNSVVRIYPGTRVATFPFGGGPEPKVEDAHLKLSEIKMPPLRLDRMPESWAHV